MRSTVLLFDIDGTLISTGGVGRRALERAFERCYGTGACLSFSFGGMTDRAIVTEALQSLAVEASGAELDRAIDEVIAVYLDVLEEETARADSFRVHRGMAEAVDRARGRHDIAVGLGTGNVRAGAAIKLNKVGLFEKFAFGGFGCDDVDRTRLLAIGAQRGAAMLGRELDQCRVVVIGDTVRDVAAARGIGAECLAVCTGASTRGDLLASQADVVCADLSDPSAQSFLFRA
ncbi:MAG TPA: HAD family hydrolase [Polyangiaceae bacterium]|nr:HAD family hydrolase [Polyangiaceae bacterium]